MPTKLHSSMRRADDLLDGKLKAKLREWRKEQRSWANVAMRLGIATGGRVVITGMTASRWAAKLGVK